jgi:mono/diheme cytochrome c family protein
MNALRTPIAATRRVLVTSLLILPCLAAAIVAGCGDDDAAPTPAATDAGTDGSSVKVDSGTQTGTDSGTDAGTDSGPKDAGDDGAVLAAQKRGQYIVEAVVGCSDCHTPRLPTGAPDMTKFLAGVDCFIDADPVDGGQGCLSSANLTNHASGLASRSDAEIKELFMNGKRPDGKFLVNVMPYYTLHNLKPEDADAIVAYLRTVPGIDHTVTARQAPFDNIPAASAPVDPSAIPNAGDAGLEAGANLDNGKYLAQFACLECHTKHTAPGTPQAIDMSKAFAGDEIFPSAALGLPSPPFPAEIITANLTPDDTGLKGWTVGQIMTAMKQGKDRTNGGLCPPMPAGPTGAFGKLTDDDAKDIASYVHGLSPVVNAIDGGSGSCVAPAGP